MWKVQILRKPCPWARGSQGTKASHELHELHARSESRTAWEAGLAFENLPPLTYHPTENRRICC